jgi:Tfp pilus assembly protein PilV
MFPKGSIRRAEAGFTLVEVLLAAMLIIIGFTALLSVIPYSSAAVQGGNQTSTATFLANQKLEVAKHVPWTATPDNDCLGTSASATAAPTVPAGKTCTLGGVVVNAGGALGWAADEGPTAITSPDGTRNFSGYSRTVRITNCGVGGGCTGVTDPGMRQVAVAVTFRPMTTSATAAASKTVTVSMIVAQR